MSDVQALVEALLHLDGQGSAAPADLEGRARILIEQLADRGFVIRAPFAWTADDCSPANLLATRRVLGLRAEDVAVEAGVNAATVRSVESANRRPQVPSIKAVAQALMRLGAGRI